MLPSVADVKEVSVPAEPLLLAVGVIATLPDVAESVIVNGSCGLVLVLETERGTGPLSNSVSAAEPCLLRSPMAYPADSSWVSILIGVVGEGPTAESVIWTGAWLCWVRSVDSVVSSCPCRLPAVRPPSKVGCWQ